MLPNLDQPGWQHGFANHPSGGLNRNEPVYTHRHAPPVFHHFGIAELGKYLLCII